MNRVNDLNDFVMRNDGLLQINQALKAGFSNSVLYSFIRSHDLGRISHGVYADKNAWIDGMYLLHLRCPGAVFSHQSALYIHGLSDREPSPFSITVKRGYSTSRLKADGIVVYTIQEKLYDIGLTSGQTIFGHTIPIYDMERTICDLARYRKQVEIQTFQTALKEYVRRDDKNLHRLTLYATLFHVDKILRPYLEVLL